MEQTDKSKRLEKMQQVADLILDKLKLRVEQEDAARMNPQALKHITGVMKDLRDIQRMDEDTAGNRITVVLEGELEDYSG